MFFFIFAACLLLNCVKGADYHKQGAQLPCTFKTYDVNNDGTVDLDEFIDATRGHTKVSPKIIFDRIDTNHDSKIVYPEFLKELPRIQKDLVYSPCKRSCVCCCYRCCNGR